MGFQSILVLLFIMKKNYPNFCKFIDKLDVASIESNMSFAYHDSRSNCGYSSDFPSGLFSTKKNIVSPSFYKFLYEIHRFNTISKKEYSHIPTNLTIYDYLCSHGFSQRLIHEYVIPMGAAIWSTCQKDTLHFPAKTFLSFWDNHCLLQFLNRPKWRTIQGGAQKYIDAVINTTKLNYFTNHPIKKIDRHSNHVTLYGETSGPMEFDLVVIATHADQALRMLSAPSPDESQLLGAWSYSSNKTTLHTATDTLPSNRSAWASWIYTRQKDEQMTATYWMNRLQSLSTNTDYFVTLNSNNEIQRDSVIYNTTYEHPMMTSKSIESQLNLKKLNGVMNTFYCGSYFGNGFHEDGISSSVTIGNMLQCPF